MRPWYLGGVIVVLLALISGLPLVQFSLLQTGQVGVHPELTNAMGEMRQALGPIANLFRL